MVGGGLNGGDLGFCNASSLSSGHPPSHQATHSIKSRASVASSEFPPSLLSLHAESPLYMPAQPTPEICPQAKSSLFTGNLAAEVGAAREERCRPGRPIKFTQPLTVTRPSISALARFNSC